MSRPPKGRKAAPRHAPDQLPTLGELLAELERRERAGPLSSIDLNGWPGVAQLRGLSMEEFGQPLSSKTVKLLRHEFCCAGLFPATTPHVETTTHVEADGRRRLVHERKLVPKLVNNCLFDTADALPALEVATALEQDRPRRRRAERLAAEGDAANLAELPGGETTPPGDDPTPARPLSTTERRILAHCRRKAHKGERVAHHVGISNDHARRLLARLVKERRLRKAAGGYRTVQRATRRHTPATDGPPTRR